MTRKRLTLRVPVGLFAKALVRSKAHGETMNAYMVRLLAQDLEG